MCWVCWGMQQGSFHMTLFAFWLFTLAVWINGETEKDSILFMEIGVYWQTWKVFVFLQAVHKSPPRLDI